MNIWSLLAMNSNWVGLSFMWNALHPIVLPALLANLVPDAVKNTYLGLLTFVGLVIAMMVQPLSGAMSDRWSSRLGRRRPLIALGTVIDVAFLLLLAWATGVAGVVIGYVGLQISSNTAQGPLQALLRDRVAPEHLGLASSVKVLLDLVGVVAAAVVAGQLMSAGRGGPANVIVVVLAVLLVSAGLTLGLAREQSSARSASFAHPAPADSTPERTEANAGYWWLIGQRAMFLLGVYGLQAFGQYYLQDALRVPDPAREVGNLLAVVGGATLLLVLAGGWFTDRFGAKRLLFAASALAASGLLLMLLISDVRYIYLNGLLVGSGMGLFLTSNWALATRLAPSDQAGKYLGLTNIATAGAAAAARLEGPLVDVLNRASPEAWLGYKGIFVFGGLCILLSMLFLSRVKL